MVASKGLWWLARIAEAHVVGREGSDVLAMLSFTARVNRGGCEAFSFGGAGCLRC